MKLITFKKRADFLRLAASGHKYVRPNMVVQAASSIHDDSDAIHLGFTATKKIGNAVLRNRAKRRLRAAARDILTQIGLPEVDYVLIARKNCVHSAYDTLCRDLEMAVTHLNKAIKRGE